MDLNQNLKVSIFLRAAEGLLSVICGVIHVVGFMDPSEPTSHQAPFLITYFGAAALSTFEIFKLTKGKLNWKEEVITSSLVAIMFLATSIWSMINAENDPHLWQFTDSQEFVHGYFQVNLHQSIVSLVTSLLLLMHALFALDFIMTQPRDDVSFVSENDEEEIASEKPLRLHFFFENIWKNIASKFAKRW